MFLLQHATDEPYLFYCADQTDFVFLSRLAYRLRRQLLVPDVIVDFVREDEKLFVAVENIGRGPAHHVSTTFEPALRGVRGSVEVSELALFEHLSFLAPGKEIRTFLDTSTAYFERDAPTQITATVRFENDEGEHFRRSMSHDLRVYNGSATQVAQ